jgi:hypothetical protein
MEHPPIPFSPRDWNPSNPIISFQSFAHYIHEQAKSVMLRDGFHAEMFFFLPLNGRGHIVQHAGKDRDATAKWVKDHIREHYVYGLVHICEAWVRFASGKTDHILDQVIDGEIRVSELRPEDRSEALTVVAQSRDGYSHNWIDEIIRTKKKVLKFGACQEFGDFEGRFGSLFG